VKNPQYHKALTTVRVN